jgi:hypothetical protein
MGSSIDFQDTATDLVNLAKTHLLFWFGIAVGPVALQLHQLTSSTQSRSDVDVTH